MKLSTDTGQSTPRLEGIVGRFSLPRDSHRFGGTLATPFLSLGDFDTFYDVAADLPFCLAGNYTISLCHKSIISKTKGASHGLDHYITLYRKEATF